MQVVALAEAKATSSSPSTSTGDAVHVAFEQRWPHPMTAVFSVSSHSRGRRPPLHALLACAHLVGRPTTSPRRERLASSGDAVVAPGPVVHRVVRVDAHETALDPNRRRSKSEAGQADELDAIPSLRAHDRPARRAALKS